MEETNKDREWAPMPCLDPLGVGPDKRGKPQILGLRPRATSSAPPQILPACPATAARAEREPARAERELRACGATQAPWYEGLKVHGEGGEGHTGQGRDCQDRSCPAHPCITLLSIPSHPSKHLKSNVSVYAHVYVHVYVYVYVFVYM